MNDRDRNRPRYDYREDRYDERDASLYHGFNENPRERDPRDFSERMYGSRAEAERAYRSRHGGPQDQGSPGPWYGYRRVHRDVGTRREYEIQPSYRGRTESPFREEYEDWDPPYGYSSGGGYAFAHGAREGYAGGDWSDRRDFGRHELQSGRQHGWERGASHDDFRRGGRGRTERWGEQLRAAGHEIARKVKRVFRGPKGYKRSDERIREDVNDRLADQDHFDPSDIEVRVSQGEVTLTGSVRARHEKFRAEEIADGVSGVTEVHNQLRVQREQTVSGVGTGTQQPSATQQEDGERSRPRNGRV